MEATSWEKTAKAATASLSEVEDELAAARARIESLEREADQLQDDVRYERERAENLERLLAEARLSRHRIARNLARTFTIERANEKQRAEAAEARCASVREYNDRLRFDLERMEARCASIAAERDRLREELDEAHTWLLSAEMCDCEYFPGAGTKLCRFAEALDEFSPAASSPEPESEGR